jgi:hypothetical protein
MAASAQFHHSQTTPEGPFHQAVLHVHIKGSGPFFIGMTGDTTRQDIFDRFFSSFGR